MTNEGSWSLKKPKKHGKSTGNELFNAEECRVEQPDEHKSHEEVNDPPIHIEGVKCQDPVFFYFCKNRCDNTTSSVKPNARVVWFDCKDELEKGYLPSNMLSLETCDDSYPKSRWVDCYCKPDGVHTVWISTISTLAFIFVLLKFGSYFLHKYKKYRHKKKMGFGDDLKLEEEDNLLSD